MTVMVAVVGMSLFNGVSAQQVVEGVPAGAVLGEQVRVGQFGQQHPGLPGWNPGERQPGTTSGRGSRCRRRAYEEDEAVLPARLSRC